MNGRIYDPLLGRFLSADILVDGPFNLQGYNRYSYVKNNPLTYKDPSGYNAMVTGVMRPLANLQLRKQLGTEKADRVIALNDSIDRASARVFGEAVTPGVGDAMDAYDLTNPESSTTTKVIAGVSLAAGAGYLPNIFGPVARGIRRMVDKADVAADVVSAAGKADAPNVSRTEPNDIKSDGNSTNIDVEVPATNKVDNIPRNSSSFEIQTKNFQTRDGRQLVPSDVRSRTDFVDQTPTRRVDFDHSHGNLGPGHVQDIHVNPNNPSQINVSKPRAPEPGEYLSPVFSDPRTQGGVFRP